MNIGTATLDDFKEEALVPKRSSKIFLRKNKEVPKEKHIHIILKGDSVARLDKLQTIVEPTTQTEAISTALQLFEAFINEHESGSEFYIKRKNDSKPVKFEIFD